jgi:hypothetical protein
MKNNIELFKSLIKHAANSKKIEIHEFIEICNKFNAVVNFSEIKNIVIHSYSEKLKTFLNDKVV